MPSSSRSAATPLRIATAQNERAALELRLGGSTFDEIAKALGYGSKSTAWRAVDRALRATIQEPADELRRVERERLDALLAALWPAAMSGSHKAVTGCLAVMDRRARLLGLDAPTRHRIDVITADAFHAALRELEDEVAALEAPAAGDAE